MDYKRIQIILIATFTLLNLYLLTVLLEKDKEINFANANVTVQLEEGMRNDNIEAPALSNEKVRLPILKTDVTNALVEQARSLSNQTTRLDNNVLSSILATPIELDMEQTVSIEDRLEPLERFMKDGNIIEADSYRFFSYQEATKRMIYSQYYEDYPILDGTGMLIFQLNQDNEIISYEQTFMGVPEAQGNNRSVLSEQAAIESLYLSNQIPAQSKLQNISLTYYQTLKLEDMTIYSPMWYVEIVRDDLLVEVRQVDALTGTVLSPQATLRPESGVDSQSSDEEARKHTSEEIQEMQLPDSEEAIPNRVLISE